MYSDIEAARPKRQRVEEEEEASHDEANNGLTKAVLLKAEAQELAKFSKHGVGEQTTTGEEQQIEAAGTGEEQVTATAKDKKKDDKFVAVHGQSDYPSSPFLASEKRGRLMFLGLLCCATGNYRGYYSKRRFGQDPYTGDERLALIPREWLADKRVLDIGCNAGRVTIEIGLSFCLLSSFCSDCAYWGYTPTAQSFGAYRVTGVDIDGDLIREASKEGRSVCTSSGVMHLNLA